MSDHEVIESGGCAPPVIVPSDHGAAVNELERTREHLRNCQENLRLSRGGDLKQFVGITPEMEADLRLFDEQRVLEALDQLWDAQEAMNER
jgi:hypothetical protein